MSWWKKVVNVVVPLGSLVASIFVKNPKNKEIAEQVKIIVDKIPKE